MQSLFFWKGWSKEHKRLWLVVAAVFVFSFCFFWITNIQNAGGIIKWERLQEQKVLESTVHTFNAGPFELSVPAENYVIIEYFNGSPIAINQVTSIIFVIGLILCSTVLLTVITTLERFWYFVGMGLFILFVVSLRLEVVAVFFQRNRIFTISILTVYVAISYYFQALNPAISFKKRLAILAALTLVVSSIVYMFSGVQYPALHIAVTGYSAGMVLTVLFILMVAHEIPATFVYVASQGNSKSLRHFSILSGVYIFYVLITCLHELNVIHWNFVYLNLYLLLSISALLGLWGFKLREPLYSTIFPNAPLGIYFYVTLAAVSFFTIGQFFGTSNDPALRIIKHIIIFSHVGYGILFLTYVFSNFVLMLAQNLAVYKVLYKPNRMPYFTFRLAGLIMTLAFIFYSGWSQYLYNSMAGFYNNIADLYELLDRPATAEAYYEQGRNYGFENNHANYALGSIKASRFSFEEAHRNYELANGSVPTVYSLVNEGNLFIWQNNIFEAITTYHKGDRKMPGVGEIENNLGLAYGRIYNMDSALVYLNKSRRHKNSRSTGETNFVAIAALEYLPINCDSVLKIFDNPSDATLSNAVALATTQNKKINVNVDLSTRGRLTLYSATLLNNYIIQNAKTLDSTFINRAYKIASDSVNRDYNEALKSSIAFSYYHRGNVSKALQVLAELVYISQSHQGKFNYIMGLWALEQNNPQLAASYFAYATEADYKEGKLYQAIALSEAQKVDEAYVAWDSVAASHEQSQQQMAASVKRILKTSLPAALELNDAEKYQFCRYRLSIKDTVFFYKLITSFKQDNYKAQALLDMTRRQYEWDNINAAINCYSKIEGLKLTDSLLYQELKHIELLMLASRGELRTLAKQINKGISFTGDKELEKLYFTALLNQSAGDTLKATKNFEVLGVYNPYFEEGIIAAANYFKGRDGASLKPYTILVEAIQINNNSVKLLKAYSQEAMRMGFTEYAQGSLQRVNELNKELD